MSVKFEKVAEIRRPFQHDRVKLPARTKNGQQLPAMEFDKDFYNAEMDGEAVLLRVREGMPISKDFKKGDMVVATFEEVGVESDVSQMYILSLTPVKGAK